MSEETEVFFSAGRSAGPEAPNVSIEEKTGRSARYRAFWASKNGDLNLLKPLVEQYPKVIDMKDKYGNTPLILAARNSHLKRDYLEVAEYLISLQWKIRLSNGTSILKLSE